MGTHPIVISWIFIVYRIFFICNSFMIKLLVLLSVYLHIWLFIMKVSVKYIELCSKPEWILFFFFPACTWPTRVVQSHFITLQTDGRGFTWLNQFYREFMQTETTDTRSSLSICCSEIKHCTNLFRISNCSFPNNCCLFSALSAFSFKLLNTVRSTSNALYK